MEIPGISDLKQHGQEPQHRAPDEDITIPCRRDPKNLEHATRRLIQNLSGGFRVLPWGTGPQAEIPPPNMVILQRHQTPRTTETKRRKEKIQEMIQDTWTTLGIPNVTRNNKEQSETQQAQKAGSK
jgi:hypothetical protein